MAAGVAILYIFNIDITRNYTLTLRMKLYHTAYAAIIVLIGFKFNVLAATPFEVKCYITSSASEVIYDAEVSLFFLGSQRIQAVNRDISGEIKLISADGKLDGELRFAADGFNSNNRRRDGNVAYYLGYPEHPIISFVPRRVDVSGEKVNLEDWRMAELHGELSVNGVTRELSFPIKYRRYQEMLSIEGTLDVAYSDFRIRRPTVLGGLVKRARKRITLNINWVGKTIQDERE